MIHILTYTFTPNYLEERTPYRSNHFEHLKPYINKGELLLGGAIESDNPQGVLVFDNLKREEIEQFANTDPYIINRIAIFYKIEKWNVVAGSLFENLTSANN